MEIPVLIEPVAGNGFVATTGEPLALRAEGKTRDEAISLLQQMLAERVSNGAEVIEVQIPGARSGNPWVEFAGMFKDDPYFDEVVEIMASWANWGFLRHDGGLRPIEIAEAIAHVVATPRGTNLAIVEIQPEAPRRDPL